MKTKELTMAVSLVFRLFNIFDDRTPLPCFTNRPCFLCPANLEAQENSARCTMTGARPRTRRFSRWIVVSAQVDSEAERSQRKKARRKGRAAAGRPSATSSASFAWRRRLASSTGSLCATEIVVSEMRFVARFSFSRRQSWRIWRHLLLKKILKFLSMRFLAWWTCDMDTDHGESLILNLELSFSLLWPVRSVSSSGWSY